MKQERRRAKGQQWDRGEGGKEGKKGRREKPEGREGRREGTREQRKTE